MTYLLLEDGHTYINTDHIAQIHHTPAAKGVSDPVEGQSYTRLNVVGLSSSVLIKGIPDIGYFIDVLHTTHTTLNVTEFLKS